MCCIGDRPLVSNSLPHSQTKQLKMFRSIAVLLAVAAVASAAVVTATPLNFNYSNTLRFVYYADAASDNTTVAKWDSTCLYCTAYPPASTFQVSVAKYDKLLQSFGYLGRNDQFQEIAIVFRGSTTTRNWITDLVSLKQVPFKYSGKDGALSGKVGMGFQAYYESLRLALTGEALKSLMSTYKTYSVQVIGHSLGGAAASLCAVDLKLRYPAANIHLTTFGEPRTGNGEWARFQNFVLGQGVTRVVNNHDIVPHLPPHFAAPVTITLKNHKQYTLDVFAHECTEVWERPAPLANGSVPTNVTFPGVQNYTQCSCNELSAFPGEDPACSDSLHKLTDFSLMQHNQYMGVNCCKGVNEPASGYISPEEEKKLLFKLWKWIHDHKSFVEETRAVLEESDDGAPAPAAISGGAGHHEPHTEL